uniref:Putative secreted protein n=1 Tax=Ixodes ricinus TaxID=34613 RepID=A0A6B0U343_IXORI
MLYCTPLANLFWRLCSIVCMPDGGWGFPPDASLLPTSFLRAVSILLFWRLPGSGGTDLYLELSIEVFHSWRKNRSPLAAHAPGEPVRPLRKHR